MSIAVRAPLRFHTSLDAPIEAAGRLGVAHDVIEAAHTADSADARVAAPSPCAS